MKKKLLNSLFRLDGKVIIITGAAGLLGRKHAEIVAAYGGITILIDIDHPAVTQLAAKLEKVYSVGSIGLKVDITEETEVHDSCQYIISKYGKIDGLVNNAANNPKVENSTDTNFTRLENFPIEIWNKDIAVGLTGAYLCSKYYGSAIAANENGGVIINISSDLGLIAPDQRLYHNDSKCDELQSVKPVTYSVVKTGLIGLTRYLATYWADKNVRCNVLCPGGIENGQSEDFLEKVSSRIPLGRLAKSDEYQGALLFMLSDASAYLNGAIIPIDGGRTAW